MERIEKPRGSDAPWRVILADGNAAIQIAIVAVPGESAQAVTEKLVAAGIKTILNFAPGRIKAGRDVRLKNVDLAIELETLSFYLAQGSR